MIEKRIRGKRGGEMKNDFSSFAIASKRLEKGQFCP